jgi:hypothetical protein
MTKCLTNHNWEGKTWKDTLGRYGCLVTSFANIMQYNMDKNFTPKNLNDILVEFKCYNYLQNNNCEEAKASYIDWATVQEKFKNSFIITRDLEVDDFRNHNSKRYIAKIKHPRTGGGHYINILEKGRQAFWCFDVDSGEVVFISEEYIIKIHEFNYIGA